MRRFFRRLVNPCLAVASVLFVFYAVRGCDMLACAWLTPRLWPGNMGLIFEPGACAEYDMYDFKCTEKINSLGFRDRETPARKTCKYRAVAIGDSFTYGWGVNIGDAWCKRLEQNLRARGMDIEILNLGRPAAGPDEYAAIAESAVPLLEPDLVVVGVLAGDDLQQLVPPILPARVTSEYFPNLAHLVNYLRNRRTIQNAYTPQPMTVEKTREMYVNCAKELDAGFSPEQRERFGRLEEPVRKLFWEGRLNPWMLNHSTQAPDYFMNTLSLDDLGWLRRQLAFRDFRRIDRAARRGNARTLVVSIPEGFYVNREAHRNVQRIGFHVVPEMLEHNAADKAVQLACNRAGVPFCCVTDEFRKHADEKDLYFELDRHMTARGHALYADLITARVAAQIGDAAKP
jgi:lysophospholipase L1-like esterase